MLQSRVLQFSSDGKRLAFADADGVSVADLGSNAGPVRIKQPAVSAVATFAQQVWTLDEQRALLRRYDRGGRLLGVPRELSIAPCTEWLVAPTGAAAVVVRGTASKAVIEHFDELIEVAAPARGLVIPLDGRRHIVCQDQVVRFGAGITARLANGVVPLGGAALFEAKALLVLVQDARGGVGAIVFATENGRALQQFEVFAGQARAAAQRGMLIVLTSERRLAAIDTRSGRPDGFTDAPVDVDDFAIDPLAKRIAIRSGSTVLVYLLGQLAPNARPEMVFNIETQPPAAVQQTTVAPASKQNRLTSPIPLRISCAPSGPSATPPVQPVTELHPHASVEPLPMAVGATPSQVPRVREIGTLPGIPFRGSITRASASSEPPSPTGTAPPRATLTPNVEPQLSLSSSSPQRTSPRVGDSPVQAPVVDLFKLRGFGAPPKRLDITRHDAARMLEHELRWIELRALLAIARGWDSGRIAYANESRHPQELEATATLAGNPGGRAPEQVAAAHAELVQHERTLIEDPERRTDSTPLGALAVEFQLSPLATDILMVVAAPRLRGELSRLYAILANDPKRALVDELLVEQILGDDGQTRSDIAYELGANGPLNRFGLVHVDRDRSPPHAALAVDPVVVARLRVEPINFGRGAATSVRSADRPLHELLVPAELLLEAMRYLSQAASEEHQPRIAVRGPVGSGRRTLLAALAQKAGRDLGMIDLKRLPRQSDEFAAGLRTELQRSLLRGLLPCLTRLDDVSVGNDDPVRELVQDILRSHPGPAAVHLSPRSRVPLDPGHLLLELQPPTETARVRIWSEALAQFGLSVKTPELLAARYRVGAGTIRSAARSVAEARAEQGRLAGDVLVDIEQRMRQMREVKLGDQARRVERLADWSSLVLPEETLYSLRELVGRARHRRTVFDQWGFDQVLSTARGLTALFEGPPGTGKTLVAGVIARELGLDLYQVDLSKVMSKWVGETEKNLGAIFDAAEDGQAILLFDEADSLFAKRSEVKSSNDRFANLEVNFLLQRLDSFEGFAILTTNFGTSIDPAFKRRLSYRLTFPFPDQDARMQLWRVHLPAALPIDGVLDLDALATKYELSGGYIRNACVRAAFLAAEDGTPLSQEHLERAVQLEYAEMGKLSRSGRME